MITVLLRRSAGGCLLFPAGGVALRAALVSRAAAVGGKRAVFCLCLLPATFHGLHLLCRCLCSAARKPSQTLHCARLGDNGLLLQKTVMAGTPRAAHRRGGHLARWARRMVFIPSAYRWRLRCCAFFAACERRLRRAANFTLRYAAAAADVAARQAAPTGCVARVASAPISRNVGGRTCASSVRFLWLRGSVPRDVLLRHTAEDAWCAIAWRATTSDPLVALRVALVGALTTFAACCNTFRGRQLL